MKNSSAFLCCLFLLGTLNAQESAKKYVLIEHFTNSNCPPCAARNPGFYNLITQPQYADDVHHISVHPVFPYPQCVFYQANTVENTAWTSLYPVQGTPTIVLNGAIQNPANPLLSEAKLQSLLGQTSPLYLKVTESGLPAARQVNVQAKALGDIPPGNYKIFVAIAEKTVNQQTPNGETVHRNVFRKMLTSVSGDPFSVPASGESSSFDFTYAIPNTWVADEVYVLAFVKEVDTKQILNSGTRFDPVLSGTGAEEFRQLSISPNPANDLLQIDLAEDLALQISIYDAKGQRMEAVPGKMPGVVSLSVANYPSGVYYLKVTGQKHNYTGKFIKA